MNQRHSRSLFAVQQAELHQQGQCPEYRGPAFEQTGTSSDRNSAQLINAYTSINKLVYFCVEPNDIIQQSPVQFHPTVQEISSAQKGWVRYM